MAVIHKPAGEQYLLTHASIRKFFPPVTTAIVVMQIGLYIAESFSSDIASGIVSTLGASLGMILGRGFAWQFLTYMLVNNSGLILVLNAVALISISSRLERLWGVKYYLLFIVLIGVIVSIPLLLLGTSLITSFGLVIASAGASGWAFRRQFAFLFTYRIPVPLYMGVAILILMLLNMQPIYNLLWFVAAPLGILFARVMESRQKNRAYANPPKPKSDARFKELDLGE